MATRLIVNADDFGLTRGINRAIGELHQAGAITSATLMANGPAFDDAVEIARAHPTLGVGCHIVLTDGKPISPPETVQGLLAKHGTDLRSSPAELFRAVLLGQATEAEIEREAIAQIQKLQSTGLHVTHIDTHKHTHILPGVARPLLRAAERCGVRAIRNPFEAAWSVARSGGPWQLRLQVGLTRIVQPHFLAMPQIQQGILRTSDSTLGIATTGTLNACALQDILTALPVHGTFELLCHPGYNDADLDAVPTRLRAQRETEYQALLQHIPQLRAQPNAPQLIHYTDI